MKDANLAKRVGEGVKATRGMRGQRAFATANDVSQGAVSKYERGEIPRAFLRFLYNLHIREGVDLNALVAGRNGSR